VEGCLSKTSQGSNLLSSNRIWGKITFGESTRQAASFSEVNVDEEKVWSWPGSSPTLCDAKGDDSPRVGEARVRNDDS